MARNWGYALDVGGPVYYTDWSQVIKQPPISGYIALAKSDPGRYKIAVNISRTFPKPIPDGFWVTNGAGYFVDRYASNTWQYATNTAYQKVVSPESPDPYWESATEYWMKDIRILRSNVPVAIVLNAGEYGLDVPAGGNATAWSCDPRVQAATNGMSWARYASNRKAHQLGFLTRAVQREIPDRELYIFYNTGFEARRRISPPSSPDWGFNSDVLVTNTDLPSFECYYQGFDGEMWTGNFDLLTQYLNCVGYNLRLGYGTNYSWLCGGWDRGNNNPSNFSDIPRYIGFLKCAYTGGMVGGAAGYFAIPTNGFDAAFDPRYPPHWLLQVEALARVHALFSHLEDFLFEGVLLPGPAAHKYSQDQPAYEFPTGDPNARVLARKLRHDDQWLITAWAADGTDRNVTVTIPTLGTVQVLARDCGAVYRGSLTNLTLIDSNGLLPTEVTGTAPPRLRLAKTVE